MQPKVVHLIITNLIRLTLILTFIYATTSARILIQTVAAAAFLITLTPTILHKLFKIQIPSQYEIIYLMFIYGLLTLGELKGLYSGSLWWSLTMTFTASLALGFTSLAIIFVLQKTHRISPSPLLAAILIFSLALSLATLWEIFEFTLDTLIHSGLQKNLIDTMQDISINILGALLVSITSYTLSQNSRGILASTFLTGILEKNSSLFGPSTQPKTPNQIVKDILQIGETAKIEFKSTIRTNLYTNQFDKKIEKEILKTITAFLNTSGGNLLIGVNDKSEILGLEQDNFPNHDKMGLYITNLIKTHIGNQFLPFIKFHITKIQNKTLVLVLVKESPNRVFLKISDEENFYIRNGPASLKLKGNALIDYINHKFSQ